MKANISWITDNLACGGDLAFDPEVAASQVDDILEQEIDTIIDVRQEANDKDLWAELGVEYIHIPTDDAEGHHIPHELFDEAVYAAMRTIEGEGKVLIHCHMGVNRAPSVAFGVLLEQGMDPIEAYDLIREKRSQAGLFYVLDALEADQVRNKAKRSHPNVDREMLKRHIKKVWTPEEQERIAHVIRDHHATDAREILMIRTEQAFPGLAALDGEATG